MLSYRCWYVLVVIDHDFAKALSVFASYGGDAASSPPASFLNGREQTSPESGVFLNEITLLQRVARSHVHVALS